MRKFFLDRVQEESVLSGQSFMYLHYADMIANGYQRTMPCPFQRQGLLLNPNGDLHYCENSQKIGNVLDDSAETLYFKAENLAHREQIKDETCPTCLSPCQVNVGAMKQFVPYAKFLKRAYTVKRASGAPPRDAAGRRTDPMNNGGRGRLLRMLVAVGLTGYVLWRADPARVLRATAEPDWRWIAVAVALVLVDRALMAYRWMLLLCALTPGSRPPFRDVLRIFFVSTFVGSFLPSVAGDIYRAFSLSRLQVSGVAGGGVGDHGPRARRAVDGARRGRGAGVRARDAGRTRCRPDAGPGGARLRRRSAGTLQRTCRASRPCASPAGCLARRSATLSAGLIEAVRRYAHHHGELTLVLLASVAVQGIRVLQAFCLGAALGLTAPLWAYFVFVPLIVLVMQLPVTILGLGTSQAMFALLFTRVGVPAPEAVALSILFIALGLLGNLPGALLYATGSRGAR